jgi:hypothetical protein
MISFSGKFWKYFFLVEKKRKFEKQIQKSGIRSGITTEQFWRVFWKGKVRKHSEKLTFAFREAFIITAA